MNAEPGSLVTDSPVPRTRNDIAEIIRTHPRLMPLLRAVAMLELPDCWIGAGFVRNAVWDKLHGYSELTPLNDIDVLYYDATDTSPLAEDEINAELTRRHPGYEWEAKNQARMHIRNNDQPYKDTADAMTYWLETATPIAARMAQNGQVEILSPLGIDDLLDCIVRPTPHTLTRPEKLIMYRQRMQQKDWRTRWPQLRVLFD